MSWSLEKVDQRRYKWLREQFAVTDMQMDGSYIPRFRRSLVRAKSLDESIDLTHAKDGYVNQP